MPLLWSPGQGSGADRPCIRALGRLSSVHPQCGQGLGWQEPASTLLWTLIISCFLLQELSQTPAHGWQSAGEGPE